MKGMVPLQDKAAVKRRLQGPLPYRGHVKLSTRWVMRLTLLDACKLLQYLETGGFWGWVAKPAAKGKKR